MTQYIFRRSLQAIPLLLFISVVVFALVQLSPGGPLSRFDNAPGFSETDLQRLRQQLGLDEPLPVRYVRWLGSVLRSDLGESYVTHQPVTEILAERIPNTLRLMLPAFVVTLLLAIPIGVISALKQYSVFDHVVTAIAFAGQSIPIFWFGLLLIIIFFSWLDNPYTGEPLFPAGGIYSLDHQGEFWDGVWHLVLPVTMLSLAWVSWYTRFIRSSMLEVVRQNYVQTATAKGLPRRWVIGRHAFPNAIIPLVTLIALDLPTLFAGAVFTETIFSWPGMGRLFFQSAQRRDYPVLQAIIMITAVLIVVSNLLADIVYGWLDPRIRFDQQEK
ncbi:MAG: ABC transporter permease [Anaerolineae bacterium]